MAGQRWIMLLPVDCHTFGEEGCKVHNNPAICPDHGVEGSGSPGRQRRVRVAALGMFEKKITGAFENVNVDILIEKYRELDIDEHTRYVIHRLFQYKHSVLKTGDNVVHQNNAGVSPDPTQF